MSIECFTINKSVKSGYGGHCKDCHNKKNRYRHVNRKEDADYRASSLVRAAKQRSDDVTITVSWVADKIAQGKCEVTGIPFDMSPHKPARSFTPSLDRIDPKRGYHPDNVQVVCWIYNRAKGVNSAADVLTLAKALVNGEAR
jgi:hypothetical protein